MRVTLTALPRIVSAEAIAPAALAWFVLARPASSIVALSGIGPDRLRLLLDDVETRPDAPLALFLPLASGGSAEAIVEAAADALADIALRLWPAWFGVSFAACRRDALGREAARLILGKAADALPALSRPWAEAAVELALEGRRPRVPSSPPAADIAQLCMAISPTGLILVADLLGARKNSAALVHAVEWIAAHAGAAIVLLFDQLPEDLPPFERILHGARTVAPDGAFSGPPAPGAQPWLVPVRGVPHPLSETEQRLAALLARDAELAPLFACNQFVDTVRGSRPKVDLVWAAGRLVVELDGFADHGSRAAFMHDRNRDYELMLSGYSVLRIANDEVAQDIEKALDKIRDMVRFCRGRRPAEDRS